MVRARLTNPADHPERLGFGFTEEQLAMWAMVADFARTRVAPEAAARDHSGEYPVELTRELAELGLLGMKVPIENGGPELDVITYTLALQALAQACASTAVIAAASNLAATVIASSGTPEQRRRWLDPLCTGELGPFGFALSEAHSGSDAGAMRTTATRGPGQDDYLLQGTKAWVTNATHAGAFLVMARTHPGKGAVGITAFVVERSTPGLSVSSAEDKLGQRASGTACVNFDSCRVPAANLIGKPGSGYLVALEGLTIARVGMAGLCLGMAEAAYEAGINYARERVAFGQRILDFQNTSFVLADTRTELDAAWLLALRAGVLMDRGQRAWAESGMAKMFGSEAACRAVDRMLQLHGGNGYSKGYPIERLYRDVRVTRIYEGTSEIMRQIIAAELG